jgi:hypothetical protein
MGSLDRESSLDQGAPLALYAFNRGAQAKYYTNADRDIVLDGKTFLARENGVGTAISHTEIQDGGETSSQSITVTMALGLSVADWWRNAPPPGETITCTIWISHEDEDDWLVEWPAGRVVQPDWTSTILSLHSEPLTTRAARAAQGVVISRGCAHTLYDDGCGIDPAAHELPSTLTAVNALTLTATEFLALPAGRLAGGYLEFVDSQGYTVRRSIASHPGSTITIDYGHPELVASAAISVYPGCGLTWDDCLYYENTDNYLGFLYMPDRDNFDGNPI